jgi:hypothetical protein
MLEYLDSSCYRMKYGAAQSISESMMTNVNLRTLKLGLNPLTTIGSLTT